jgi:hypothetical protein
MRRLWKIAMLLPALAMAGSLASCKLIDSWIAFDEIGHDLRAPASAPPARMDIVGGTPVLHLYGAPRERGDQYGRLLARPLRALHRCIVNMTSEERYAGVIAYARDHEAVLPPEVRAEIRAASDASGMPYLEMVALNITPTASCSALATWDDTAAETLPAGAPQPDSGLVMGRNADYYSYGFTDRGMMVVVCHPDEGVPVVSVTFLGMVGAFTGMNARGVAFGNMLVPTTANLRHEDGLTIQLALRLSAERSATADEMARALEGLKHVIPMNVMVADRRHALAMELDGNHTIIRGGEHGVLVSTNHFLHLPIACVSDSCDRYAILQAAAREAGRPMTVEQMKKALWAAKGQENVQAVIFEPSRLRMHVSINHDPAAGGPYVVLDLHDLLTPKELGSVPTTQPAGEK